MNNGEHTLPGIPNTENNGKVHPKSEVYLNQYIVYASITQKYLESNS